MTPRHQNLVNKIGAFWLLRNRKNTNPKSYIFQTKELTKVQIFKQTIKHLEAVFARIIYQKNNTLYLEVFLYIDHIGGSYSSCQLLFVIVKYILLQNIMKLSFHEVKHNTMRNTWLGKSISFLSVQHVL